MGSITVPEPRDFPALADVVIIGGGIVGSATAFYASRAGLKTLVLERRLGLATLTTASSLECIRAQFEEPENIAMMKASIEVFENFAEAMGLPDDYDIGLHQQGYLFLTEDPDGPTLLKERVERQRRLGLEDVEFLPGDEARARFPYLSPRVTAATYRARDGWLSSHETTYGFAKGSAARFFLDTEVIGFLLDEQGVAGVETQRGTVHSRAVVIAAGPFSGRLAQLAGAELPLSVLRRHKVIIGRHPLIPHDAPMTVDLGSGAHWRPEGPGAALAWAEALPEEPGEPLEQVPADWTFPALVMEAVARLSPFWEQIAAHLKTSNLFLSAGQYTVTPDHKPIIGPYPQIPGLYLNVGYSGHGVMGSPAGGRLAVDLITGRALETENPFNYDRFARGTAPAARGEKMAL